MKQSDTKATPFSKEDAVAFSKQYLDYLKTVLDKTDPEDIARFIESLLSARNRGATIFFIGNGGSAATASHFSNDLSYGTREYDLPFRSVSLTDNVAVMTALGNDNGYDEIFVRQLKVLAKPGDVLVGISASGNSSNLVEAIVYAKEIGVEVIALTAFDGGKMKQMADHGVHVPTEVGEYGPAEDVHMVLDHLVSNYLYQAVRNA